MSVTPSSPIAAAPPDATSPTLIVRIKQKDEDGWKRFVELYSPLVLHWCRRAVVPSQDRRDILQDVFRAAFAAIDSFSKTKKGDTFRGWLRSVTRSRITDYYRTIKHLPVTEQQELLDTLPDRPEADQEEQEESLVVQQAWKMILTKTDEKTRLAIELLATGLTSAEVGEQLDMKPGAVRQAKRRVKEMLKEFDGLLKQDGDAQ